MEILSKSADREKREERKDGQVCEKRKIAHVCRGGSFFDSGQAAIQAPQPLVRTCLAVNR